MINFLIVMVVAEGAIIALAITVAVMRGNVVREQMAENEHLKRMLLNEGRSSEEILKSLSDAGIDSGKRI